MIFLLPRGLIFVVTICVVSIVLIFTDKSLATVKMSIDATKPVFGVPDKARLKPVSFTTETS